MDKERDFVTGLTAKEREVLMGFAIRSAIFWGIVVFFLWSCLWYLSASERPYWEVFLSPAIVMTAVFYYKRSVLLLRAQNIWEASLNRNGISLEEVKNLQSKPGERKT